MPPELSGYTHFQRRVRMHLVEALEGGRQLCRYRGRVAQVHAGHIVALEHISKALGHAVAMRAALRGVDRLEPK